MVDTNLSLTVGPNSFIAAGASESADSAEPSSSDEAWARLPTLEPLIWSSTNADTWVPLEVPDVGQPFKLSPQLFAHSEGVLVTASWADADDAGASLFNVDSESQVQYLGELRVARFIEVFVLNDQVFVVGPDQSSLQRSVNEVSSVWVAELSS